MTVKINKLAGGYELITKRDWKNCKHCKEEINEYDFFYCDEQDIFICRACASDGDIHKNFKGTAARPHTDWHIIRVKEEEDDEN